MYAIPDLTHLRYYVPMFRAGRALGAEQSFAVIAGNTKYNGLGRPENMRKLLAIAEREGIALDFSAASADVLVTVEGYMASRLTAPVRFAVQHGFDYRMSARSISDDTVHIMSGGDYVTDLRDILPDRQAVVAPAPISTWDLEGTPSRDRTATVFYPEDGHRDVVKRVVHALCDSNYAVTIKQRRKNQPVDQDVSDVATVTYDDVWYPSESIVLPAQSTISIGFGTSAYTDLVPVGVNFVDVAVTDYSAAYFKPVAPNFVALGQEATWSQIVDAAIGLGDPSPRYAVRESVEAFMGDVLGGRWT